MNFNIGPLRMLLPDTLLGQFAGEEAHFQGQQKTLFPRHRPLQSDLCGLCRRARISDRHALNVSMQKEVFKRQVGQVHVPAELRSHKAVRPRRPRHLT